MNSPICITPSEPQAKASGLFGAAAFARAAAGMAASLLIACGGSGPDPREPAPALPMTSQASEAGEKGEGNISFHYSNKSTDANLAIDLGTTDLYLEMTGKPAQAMAEEAKAAERDQEERHPAPRKKPAKPEAQTPRDDEEEAPETETQKDGMHPPQQQPQRQGMQNPRNAPKPEEPPPVEDPGSSEAVTSKLLTGIRKAQEFFYQKR